MVKTKRKSPGRPKKKHAGGRPRKINEKVIQKLVEGFKDDFTIEEACRYAGISTPTYYDECKRNPEFSSEMVRAQDYPLTAAKKKLVKVIRSNAPDAGSLALKFLERRQRERYTPKLTLEHEGGIVAYSELESTAPKAKSPEEARRMADNCTK